MPIAQSSPLLTYQTAQRKPSKPLEQSYLEWWGQNYEGFGHNHKHYIRGELTRRIMKVPHAYCKTLTWITDVLGICELHRQLVKNDGKVSVFSENTGGKFALIRQEAAHGMHSDISKWQWSRTEGQVNLSLVTAERSEGSGSGHLGLLTSTSLSQFGNISNM